MAINIPTSGVWATISNALNLNFESAEGETGYAVYDDTQYTVSNPLVVGAGTTINLPNNAGVVINDQLPAGVATFYDGTRIVSDDPRAAYILRVNFTILNSSQTGATSIVVDISAAGDGSIAILNRSSTLVRGANTAQPSSFSELFFSRETFVANGAIVKFESLVGTSSIYDIRYTISKTHKGRA